MGRFKERTEWSGPIAGVAADRLSHNLFPNGFSRNCPMHMAKRDGPQTGFRVTIDGFTTVRPIRVA